MAVEARQLAILQSLVASEEQLRANDDAPEWILFRVFGGQPVLKPGIPNEASLSITPADLLDLAGEGYLHELPSKSSGIKFALTAAGRAAGRPRPVGHALGSTPTATSTPPGADDVLEWLVALESSAGAAVLADGSTLANQVIADFGSEHLEGVARRILDLRDDGLVRFDDPAARLEQLSESDRLRMASDFRVTTSGRDRQPRRPVGDTYITQTIQAVNAQVAAGDIQNFVTFEALLDRAEQTIDELEDIDEQTRAEAKGLLDKLRGASGTVATGAAGGAAGAVLGAVLKQLLGLP